MLRTYRILIVFEFSWVARGKEAVSALEYGRIQGT